MNEPVFKSLIVSYSLYGILWLTTGVCTVIIFRRIRFAFLNTYLALPVQIIDNGSLSQTLPSDALSLSYLSGLSHVSWFHYNVDTQSILPTCVSYSPIIILSIVPFVSYSLGTLGNLCYMVSPNICLS